MELKSVGYFAFQTPNWDAWLSFVRELVGAQIDLASDSDWARVRLDPKVQRILLERAPEASFSFGMEATDGAALESLAARLAGLGVAVRPGSDLERERRGVERLICFADPDGNRLEAYVDLAETDQPLLPSRPIGGFRTGALGVGHLVMSTTRYDQMGAFYRDVLGFSMSDFCRDPFVAEFLHINPRHHSLALIQSKTGGIQHVMLEYLDWDDVGRSYDVALRRPEIIGQTLGRHTNDLMNSFYAYTPDGFMMELGWAGRLVGPDWQVQELRSPSLWGHERHWLPPKARARAREILDELARDGVREPVVLPQGDR